MRRRRQRRRTLAARGIAGLIYAAAIFWLASPTWSPPSPQAPPAGIERRAASPSRIAVGLITPTKALPLTLPVQQVGTDATTRSTGSSTGSSGASSQSSQPSGSGGSTSTPAKPPAKHLVGFEG